MDEEQLQLLLVEELKDLRKGGGVTDPGRLPTTTILGVVSGGDRRVAGDLIMDQLSQFDDQPRMILLNAFLIKDASMPGPISDASELMGRRASYCRRHGVSERTLIRHEDAAIERLANRLAGRFSEPRYARMVYDKYDPPTIQHFQRLFRDSDVLKSSEDGGDTPDPNWRELDRAYAEWTGRHEDDGDYYVELNGPRKKVAERSTSSGPRDVASAPRRGPPRSGDAAARPPVPRPPGTQPATPATPSNSKSSTSGSNLTVPPDFASQARPRRFLGISSRNDKPVSPPNPTKTQVERQEVTDKVAKAVRFQSDKLRNLQEVINHLVSHGEHMSAGVVKWQLESLGNDLAEMDRKNAELARELNIDL